MINILRQQYYYFYRKVFGRRYQFKERDEKAIKNFSSLLLEQYGDGIGEEWIFNYLTFQFNKYSDADTKMNVQLHWIYGKKALQMWRDRNMEHHEYFDNEFREKYNIKKKDIIEQQNVDISRDYQTRERNRFSDFERRLLHCSELHLYDESSADCMFCKNNNICKKK